MIEVTQYYSFDAEGHRIGLCCCKICGAVLLLGDETFDSIKVHEQWHQSESEPKAEGR